MKQRFAQGRRERRPPEPAGTPVRACRRACSSSAGCGRPCSPAPLAAREQLANDKVTTLQERLRELDDALTTTAAGISEGVPDQLERLRALRERVASGDEEMRVFTTDLVDPVQMRIVLEELLRRQDGLTLVSAVNLPARRARRDEATRTTADAAADETAESRMRRALSAFARADAARATISIACTTSRPSSGLPWHIYWSRLDFSTDEYPDNDIVIELTTLSLDEEWIGV